MGLPVIEIAMSDINMTKQLFEIVHLTCGCIGWTDSLSSCKKSSDDSEQIAVPPHNGDNVVSNKNI